MDISFARPNRTGAAAVSTAFTLIITRASSTGYIAVTGLSVSGQLINHPKLARKVHEPEWAFQAVTMKLGGWAVLNILSPVDCSWNAWIALRALDGNRSPGTTETSWDAVFGKEFGLEVGRGGGWLM